MKAIKMTVTGVGEAIMLGNFVECINLDDDVAATLLSKDTAFIAVEGDCALSYVEVLASRRFYEYEIENIK